VEYLQRIIRPQDLQARDSSFSSTNRDHWFRELGARSNGNLPSGGTRWTDHAGHIFGAAFGGPPTRDNFFPQHPGVNANRGSRWLVDSWVDTERAMREFLGQGRPGSYIMYNVALIYPDTFTGRPIEIAWSAVAIDPNQPSNNGVVDRYTKGGRLRNDEAHENGPVGTCPKNRP